MITWKVFALAIAILLTNSCVNAAVKKAGGLASPPVAKASALNQEECTGLGGKVSAAVKCATGSACYTTDKDGVIHMACITNKK